MACEHSGGADPRSTREDGSFSCIKCGRLVPPAIGRRQPHVEAEWFDRLRAMVATTSYYVDPEAFINIVQSRLELGQRLYGDKYLQTSQIHEALEEGFDLACYAVLEHQRLDRDVAEGLDEGVAQEIRMDLLAMATFAAMADFHGRRAYHRHRQSWIPRQAE